MIDDLRGLAVFSAVAQAGSFSAAGRQLKLSTSVVSHHVSRLEGKLGVPLFFRSTRSLSLTHEGRQILSAAQRMVQAGEEALDSLSDQSAHPVGALRLALPAFGLGSAVHRAVWSFVRAYPGVSLSLHSSDRQVDLVRDGYDLALRLGTLADSALKSRRIGTFRRLLVATPGYLQGRPPITTLEALLACDFIGFSMLPTAITLTRASEDVTITPEHIRVEVDAVAAGKAAVLAGLGVQNLPLSEIEEEVRTGALVEVLPDWRLPDLGIFAVWPDLGPQKKLTRRLIDHLAAEEAAARD